MFSLLTIFAKTIHHKYLASSYMRLWLMWFQCLYVDFELDQHQTQHTNLLFLLITSILTTICSKIYSLHKKWSFPVRISSVRISPADLVTFTKEILHGKLHFFVQRLWTLWLIWTGIAGYSPPPPVTKDSAPLSPAQSKNVLTLA